MMDLRVKNLVVGGMLILLSSGSLVAASGDLRLVEAVKGRDTQTARALLRENVDVNSAQGDGATALMWAVHWNDLETADLLIQAGADVNAVNANGVTPLWLACTNAQAPMVEKLLDAGANPDSSLSRTGETVLMMCARAGSADAVKSLVARGADVNASDRLQGHTALMWAVSERHPDVVRALVEAGANVRAATTPREDIYGRSQGGFTPLLFAARVGDLESARILLDAGADVNEGTPEVGSALVVASASNHEELAVFLLEKGADPSAADDRGMTALHHAIQKGITDMSAIEYTQALPPPPNQPELVKALLSKGADPNAQVKKDYTLSVAPYRHTSPASIVGATPFFLAAAAGDVNLMRILLERGANPRLEAGDGMLPLMAAAGMSRLVDFLPGEESAHLEAVRLMLELGADVKVASKRGQTALHAAASAGADSIVKLLVEKGADINAKDSLGRTPWSMAAGFYPSFGVASANNLVSVRPHPKTAELLLELGATQLTEADFVKPSGREYLTNTQRELDRVEAEKEGSAPAQ